MFSIMKENDRARYSLVEYVADTENDVNNLPTDCLPGSSCIVAETSNVYMLNNQGQWVLL